MNRNRKITQILESAGEDFKTATINMFKNFKW